MLSIFLKLIQDELCGARAYFFVFCELLSRGNRARVELVTNFLTKLNHYLRQYFLLKYLG